MIRNKAAATTAWEITVNSMNQPGSRLAALALLEEEDIQTRRWLKIAERNIQRYQDTLLNVTFDKNELTLL